MLVLLQSIKEFMPFTINPDRSVPWNGLPELPIDETLYSTVEI
jgi:hypothetical protein